MEGIFRLNGSAKRIKELQVIFDSPDRYGKGLDWTGYTVHDAANILRRYLNNLPQPIVPLDFYEQFREPLRSHQHEAVGDMAEDAKAKDIGDFENENAILTYQRLITELPPLNRQLLLYILDLLAVFASKSDLNRMTSANLAAIFQPGLLSHPQHDMAPDEYRLSQDVLIFLIENQDSFLIGMSGTAADEKTVREVQAGQQASTPRATQAGLGRSSSNASAGADSLRKFGGIRRNVSVSSRNSKTSANIPSPVTPSSGAGFGGNSNGSGVHRSNTVPSKKSPGLGSTRFGRRGQSPTTTSPALSPGFLAPNLPEDPVGSHAAERPSDPTVASNTSAAEPPGSVPSAMESDPRDPSRGRVSGNEPPILSIPSNSLGGQPSSSTPTRERKVSGLFSKSPSSDKEHRQPNKLKKRRIIGEGHPSAHSSATSLHNQQPDSPNNQGFYTPMPTPGQGTFMQNDPLASAAPTVSNTAATPSTEVPPVISGDGTHNLNHLQAPNSPLQHAVTSSKTGRSPTPSLNSMSVTDTSDADHHDDGVADSKEKKKHRWRFSSREKKPKELETSPPVTTSAPISAEVGSNVMAEKSVKSFGAPEGMASYKPMTGETSQQGTETASIGFPSTTDSAAAKESPKDKDKELSPGLQAQQDGTSGDNKKGPIGWLKAKVAKNKEDRKEREAEKERTKSPRGSSGDRSGSKNSLSVLTAQQLQEQRGQNLEGGAISAGAGPGAGMGSLPTRGRSIDGNRGERQENGNGNGNDNGRGIGIGIGSGTSEPTLPPPAGTPTVPGASA